VQATIERELDAVPGYQASGHRTSLLTKATKRLRGVVRVLWRGPITVAQHRRVRQLREALATIDAFFADAGRSADRAELRRNIALAG
jgi:hypothetical protein